MLFVQRSSYNFLFIDGSEFQNDRWFYKCIFMIIISDAFACHFYLVYLDINHKIFSTRRVWVGSEEKRYRSFCFMVAIVIFLFLSLANFVQFTWISAC